MLVVVIARFRERGWRYLLVLIVFYLYGMEVINLLFFPLPLPGNWPANLTWKDTLRGLEETNLNPFIYFSMIIPSYSKGGIIRDIIGNILLTIPFGLGINLLAGLNTRRLIRLAFGVGISLEGTQLLLKLILGLHIHTVDINDVLFNALGVIIGFELIQIGKLLVKRISIQSSS